MGKEKVTVSTACKVRTMDPGRPEREAVAVLNNKALSTGPLESMKPWLDPYDVTVNDTFKDKVDVRSDDLAPLLAQFLDVTGHKVCSDRSGLDRRRATPRGHLSEEGSP